MARFCVIRQYYFPLDIRVRREAEALIEAGHDVDIICLARRGEARFERQGNLTIYRLPLDRRKGGALRYVVEYALFFVAAMAVVSWLHVWRRYAVVQVNSMPDALVFSTMLPRLFGARVVLDLHECMPEFFATKFGGGLGHPVTRILAWLEQASIRFADAVLTCTDQMRDAFVSRGAARDKISVVLNSANEAIFDWRRYSSRVPRDGHFVLISHGSIEERYGLDTVVRAVALVRRDIPGVMLNIYGEGSYRTELQRLVRELGVEQHVRFSDGFVPMDDLLQAIAAADAGVVPIKRDIFRDLTHCNKMFEYIAMRRPVLLSRTSAVEAYFDEGCFAWFPSDDAEQLAAAIRDLFRDPRVGQRMAMRAAEVNEPYRWQYQRRLYVDLMERCSLARPDSARGRRPTRTTPGTRNLRLNQLATSGEPDRKP